MKYLNIPLGLLLTLAMTSWSLAGTANARVPQQNQSTALERGYRTGYSDGFSAGSQDTADHAARDYRSKIDYQSGNRNYNQVWGPAEDYRDGYQQGFEAGYNAGFDGRPFESSIPSGLARREVADTAPVNRSADTDQDAGQTVAQTVPQNVPTNANSSGNGPGYGPLAIPRDAILTVELESSLSTDASQRGDRFQARVIEPREFAGAIVEGRVTQVKRSGKVKGTAELQLSFETIRLDNRSSGFNAAVVEVVDMGSRDDSAKADSEGGIKAKSSTKDDVSKVGASAGIGAIIGAVFGGGQGAAIGAAIGGAVGTGSVLSKRGKDVRLDRGQQLKIRTATETRIE